MAFPSFTISLPCMLSANALSLTCSIAYGVFYSKEGAKIQAPDRIALPAAKYRRHPTNGPLYWLLFSIRPSLATYMQAAAPNIE
jgi:hypothetical protein